MASGRGNKLVGQAGEYLVAAELARRGLIATTFTGNVPHYDIVASNERGHHISVQVKTVTTSSIQFGKVDTYVEIEFQGKAQVVGEIKPTPVRDLVYVFVKLAEYGTDRFFICTWRELCKVLRDHHVTYLAKHDGIRPKRWDSLHIAISINRLAKFENRWELMANVLG